MTASTIAIDAAAVIQRLSEHGISASLNADGTEAQIYFDNYSSALLIGKDGDLAEVTWDRTGGVQREVEVAQVTSTEQAVHAARQWHYAHTLKERAQAVLDFLQEEVPPNVMHWAVEGAKPAMRDLIRMADDINFMRGRD